MSLAAHGASACESLHSKGGTEAICVLSCSSPHGGKGAMCRHRIPCEHVASTAALRAEEGLPGSSPRASLLSLVRFPGSLSVALEGSLASNELSKLWVTACHTKQLLLPAPLGGWLPTPNSCGIPTPWCLHGGRAGSGGPGHGRAPSASLPLWAVRGVAQSRLRAGRVLPQNRWPDCRRSRYAQLLCGSVSI